MEKNIDKKKILMIVGVSFLCALFVALIILGVCLGIRDWGDSTSNLKDYDSVPDTSSLIVTPDEEYGIALTSSEATVADDGSVSQVITATAKTDSGAVINGMITWSYRWRNSVSDWADDKTLSEYVTLEPDGDSCIVTCTQAFGEQISVYASCGATFASCFLDYVKRPSEIDFYYVNGKSANNNGPYVVCPIGCDHSSCDRLNTVQLKVSFAGSTGTVYPDIEINNLVSSYSSNFTSKITDAIPAISEENIRNNELDMSVACPIKTYSLEEKKITSSLSVWVCTFSFYLSLDDVARNIDLIAYDALTAKIKADEYFWSGMFLIDCGISYKGRVIADYSNMVSDLIRLDGVALPDVNFQVETDSDNLIF